MDYTKLDKPELLKLVEGGDALAEVELKSRWDFKKWYKKHGVELNKSRRSRYATDPAYRKQVLEANRASRAKRREHTTAERAKEHTAIKAKVSRQFKVVTPDDDDSYYVTIGALAKALNRSKLGVRILEKKGVIPQAPLRNKQGERLYTIEMVEQIRKLLKAQGRLNEHKKPSVPESIQCLIQLSDGVLVDTLLFRVGKLAEAVGRSTITLEQMERRGVLPETPFRLPPNRRAFTWEQIQAVYDAFEKHHGDLRGVPVKTIHDEIQAAWAELKLIGAKFLSVSTTTEGKSDGKEVG